MKTVIRILAVVAGLLLTMAMAAPAAFAAPVTAPKDCPEIKAPAAVPGEAGELVEKVVGSLSADWCVEKPKENPKESRECEHGYYWDHKDDKCKKKHDDRDKKECEHGYYWDKDAHKCKHEDKDVEEKEEHVNGEYTQVKSVPVGAVKTGDGSSL